MVVENVKLGSQTEEIGFCQEILGSNATRSGFSKQSGNLEKDASRSRIVSARSLTVTAFS